MQNSHMKTQPLLMYLDMCEFLGPLLKWYENRFSIRCSRLCIIHTLFEVRYVPVVLENVLHNQNVSVRHMKIFLRASKVKFFAKTHTEWRARQSFRDKMRGFLAKNFTSETCRKFSTRRAQMFGVCKTFF